jgi:glycosyltransferase 2 family protein
MLLGVAATCVFGYLAVRHVDFGRFRDGLAQSDYAWLVPALAALALGVWVRAVRWRLLFAPETRPPLASVTVALLIGYFFNQLLPARAGEAARVLALHRDSGTSRAEAAGTAVAERIYDVLSLLLLLFVGSTFLPSVPWIRRAAIFAMIFTFLIVVAIVGLLRYRERPISFVLRPLTRLPSVSSERTDAIAANLIHGLAAMHRPQLAIPALIATFASWLVLAMSSWCGLMAFHFGLGYGAGLLVVITTNLVLVVPSAPAAVGAFEAAVVLALDPYVVDHSKALAAAVVLHALNLFPFLAAGVWAMRYHNASVRRRMKAETVGAR